MPSVLRFCSIAASCIVAMPAFAQIPSNAVMWLRADSGVVAPQGIVSSWRDAGGRANDAQQPIEAQRPTLLAPATNGRPAVRFNGAQHMVGASVFPTASDYTLTFVVRINNFAATNNIVSGTMHAHYLGGNALLKVLHNANFNTQCVSSIPLTTEFNIVTTTYVQSRQRSAIYVNGLFADSSTTDPNLDSTIFLGAFRAANYLNGDIAEVALYDRELSAGDRTSLESYLFDRYAITRPEPPPPPDTTFTIVPAQMQFLARESNDSATVPIAGTIRVSGYDSIYVTIERNGVPWKRVASRLDYVNSSAPFAFAPSINAGLSEYRFTVAIKSALRDSVIAVRDSIVCGDVFLINGQSNSIVGIFADTYEFARTFGKNFSPSKRDTLWSLARADGSGGGPHVGAWGMRLQQLLIESTGVPICVINGGVGGTSIAQHQRVDANPLTLSTIYGSMLYRVRKSGLIDKAKAMLWYQGESNTIDGYYDGFKALYDDWKLDYPSIEKIYVVQIRPGCAAGDHLALRELQRTLSDSLSGIESFSVMGVPGHDGCHYSSVGYDTIGAQLYRLVARDFYRSSDTVDISSPDIEKAFYTSEASDELAMVFSNARNGLALTPDIEIEGAIRFIRNSFFLDDSLNGWQSARASGDTVYLSLGSRSTATTVSYIPGTYYPATTVVYEGPWIKNMRGVGAFSFHRFPITQRDPSVGVAIETRKSDGIAAHPNPFTDHTQLAISLTEPGTIELSLFDAYGRRVHNERRSGELGMNLFAIDRGALASGLYICLARTPVETRSIRLVVLR